MRKIAILGGSGFIGKHLINELVKDYKLVILSRSPEKHKNIENKYIEVIKADYDNPISLSGIFSMVHGVVNLIGESVDSRWTKQKKKKIYNSRVLTSKIIAEAFQHASKKPSFLIQGSGIGVYGHHANETDIDITEDSSFGTDGFLTNVGVDNENAVRELHKITRVVYLRTGIVMDAAEGAFPQMALPFKFLIGGPIGSGKQWNSWIHIKDEARAIKFLIDNEQASGAYNLTAPNPVTNAQMSRVIGKALGKPSAIPAPAFMLKIMFGKMADELLLNGLKVIPKKLLHDGFHFKFETIEEAIGKIFNKNI